MLADFVGLAVMLGVVLLLVGGQLATGFAASRRRRRAARTPVRACPAGELETAPASDAAARERELDAIYRVALAGVALALQGILLAVWAAAFAALPGAGLAGLLVVAVPLVVGGAYLGLTGRLRW